jgi:predicted GNAT family acetyltransferase
VTLQIDTDPSKIAARLDAVVATDPVRHTILATVLEDVRGGAAGWCASDGAAVAARSSGPVTVTGGWPDTGALAAALARLGDVLALRGRVEVVDDLVARLGRPVRHSVAERLFRCDAVVRPAGVPGRGRRAGQGDRDRLAAWREPFLVETFGRVPPGTDLAAWPDQVLRGGGAWLWEDAAGDVVAQAVARTSVAGAVRIGGVFTPPEQRRRGYGAAVTAALTADVLDRGEVPCLFTDLANPTSNKIYQQIGFRPVEDARAVWFV